MSENMNSSENYIVMYLVCAILFAFTVTTAKPIGTIANDGVNNTYSHLAINGTIMEGIDTSDYEILRRQQRNAPYDPRLPRQKTVREVIGPLRRKFVKRFFIFLFVFIISAIFTTGFVKFCLFKADQAAQQGMKFL